MYRIGYAGNGIVNWDRRGLVLGRNADIDWMNAHVESPSVIHIGKYYLMAFEGWNDEHGAMGIGLALAEE